MKSRHVALLGFAIAAGLVAYLLSGVGRPHTERQTRPEPSPDTKRTVEEAPTSGELAAGSTVVRGHVFDANDHAFAGAIVEAVKREVVHGYDLVHSNRWFIEPDVVAARTHSNVDGAYELLVAQGGHYAIRARSNGYAQDSTPSLQIVADTSGLDFRLCRGGEVSGRVTDVDGKPVAAARVFVVPHGWLDTGRAAKPSTTSRADGRFSLRVLRVGGFHLWVHAPGFSVQGDLDIEVPAIDVRVVLERGVTVRVRVVDAEDPETPLPGVTVLAGFRRCAAIAATNSAGEAWLRNLSGPSDPHRHDLGLILLRRHNYVPGIVQANRAPSPDGVLDFGEIKLSSGGVIRGRVLNKETGDPIAGARVRSFGGVGLELELLGTSEAVSRADGSFVLKGVPLDAYWLHAYHPDFVQEDHPPRMMLMYLPGGMEPLFAPDERTATHDIRLLRATTVLGAVATPDGEPVPGATVYVVSRDGDLRAVYGGAPSAVVTDPKGRFSLATVGPDETVRLAAAHAAFGRSLVVATRGSDQDAVSLVLSRPVVLRGKVVDERSRPVAGVRVLPWHRADARPVDDPNEPDPPPCLARPAFTDQDGRYLLRNAPSGEILLVFEHPSLLVLDQPLDVAPGIAEFDVGKTVLLRGNGVEGVVVDEDGRPVSGVSVSVSLRFAPDAAVKQRWYANTVTDEQGSFEASGLVDGKLEIECSRKGLYVEKRRVEGNSRDVRIVMRKAAPLRGRVTCDGIPVAGAKVEVMESGGSWLSSLDTVFTSDDGVFVVEDVPRHMRLTVRVQHALYEKAVRTNVSTSDGVLRFELNAGLRVGGIVVNPEGAPVANIAVNISVDGSYIKEVHPDRKGRFEAGGLPEGRITVEVNGSLFGYLDSAPVEAAAGSLAIRLVAIMGETITGTILSRDALSAPGVHIEAIGGDGKAVGHGFVSLSDGTFRLKCLPPGSYRIRVYELVRTEPERGFHSPIRRHDLAELSNIPSGTSDLEIRIAGD